jgi:hypothetical protein
LINDIKGLNMSMDLLGGLVVVGGMCYSCNSYSCHHVMQGQAMSAQMYESHVRNAMGQQPRSLGIQEVVDQKQEDKKRKLLLLLR